MSAAPAPPRAPAARPASAVGPLCRYAVFVDAGYLLASAGQLVHQVADRRALRVNAIGLIELLERQAQDALGGQLLRVYWFDGAKDKVPTVQQREIAAHRGVKVRLGNVNAAGQQKGVDALLRTDMETLARNRALTDVVLVAGDEDMLPAVEAAQAYGVRVHVWGVEPEYGRNVSERLEWEADSLTTLTKTEVADFFSLAADRRRRPVAVAGAAQEAPAAVRATAGDAAAPSPAALAKLACRPAVAVEPSSRVVYASSTGECASAPLPAHLAVRYRGREADWMREVGEQVAAKWLVTRGRDNLADLLPGPQLPSVIDQELLVAGEDMLGFSLRPYKESRSELRNGFWDRLWREFGVEPPTGSGR